LKLDELRQLLSKPAVEPKPVAKFKIEADPISKLGSLLKTLDATKETVTLAKGVNQYRVRDEVRKVLKRPAVRGYVLYREWPTIHRLIKEKVPPEHKVVVEETEVCIYDEVGRMYVREKLEA
jgi:hypothetical protein